MKKYSLYGVGIVVLLVFIFLFVRHAQSVKNVDEEQKIVGDGKTVLIKEDGFVPTTLTVPVGTTIRFVNSDTYWHWPASDPHPSHTFYPQLDPKEPIKPDGVWEVTLDTVGTWGIHDHLAPYVIGTITVAP